MGDELKYELQLQLEINTNLNHQHHYDDVSSSSSYSSSTCTTTTTASAARRGQQLDSSNIGFQLLKKHGWTEGTGLGLSQQGRLEPIEAYVKKNKKGVGADTLSNKKTTTLQSLALATPPTAIHKSEKKSKKEKALSKRLRKMLEEDKRQQEKEFQRAFFREFWPDNV